MKIGIFVATAGRRAGGPEVYETALVRSLAKIDKDNEYHIYCFNKAAERSINVRQENFVYHQLWLGSNRPLSMLSSLPLQVQRAGLDTLHATFIPPPYAVQKYIYSLLCYSPFAHPEHYPLAIRLRIRALMSRGVKKSKLNLCISQNIVDTAAEYFKIPLERFSVIYLAANESFRPVPDEERKTLLRTNYGIRDPYILFSGRWEQRKNLLGTIEAFARVKKEFPSNLKLVLTGHKTWLAKKADAMIARLKIQDDVIDLGKSPFEELPALYSGALALVYPSFWEGFGLPIVEAMACGTPVITSNVSSMPEIAGSAALLVDPYSIEELAAAIHKVTTDSALRGRLSAEGLKQSKKFSWETTARETLAAYKKMAATA
jgi:glycosyltransferase involved in cell wall biosynthesis